MDVIESAICIQFSKEEKDKLCEAREVLSHLYNTMDSYNQNFVSSNDGNNHSKDQVWEAWNLLTYLILFDKFQLEN